MRSLLLSLVFVLAGSSLSGQTSSAPLDYRVGPRDLLEVRVEQDQSLNTIERVGADGRLPMPLIGPVYVHGLSPAEIEGKIATLLSEKYITDPTVTVLVREYESEVVSVFGEVRQPGRIPATPNMTLLQAITAAGGLSPKHGASVQILRIASNGLADQIEISLDELMRAGNPDVNLPVRADDVINVLPDPEVSIYLLGEVMKQGVTTFKGSSGVTLLQAIAAAGGLTDRASTRDIAVIRMTPPGEQRLEFNLNRILAGREPDPKLQNNDRIFVRESFF